MILDLETREGLQRCLTVQLSDKHFKNAVIQQQSLLANDLGLDDLKLDDLCSGKEIMQALKQKIDAGVRENVLNKVINSSFE